MSEHPYKFEPFSMLKAGIELGVYLGAVAAPNIVLGMIIYYALGWACR